MSEDTTLGCPVVHGDHAEAGEPFGGEQDARGADPRLPHPTSGSQNQVWWPNRLNLKLLEKGTTGRDPQGNEFNYKEAFNSLDLAEVKKDIETALTTSQDWWPADFGHYGPLAIRVAWHSAGTYRVWDGRGGAGTGQQRFAPLNSWPDNVNTDKGRRILWDVKKKYGKKISWADLLILAGNVALESMGFKTYGFGGGREDAWTPEDEVNWGAEATWLGTDKRFNGGKARGENGVAGLDKPFAATHMGLIYVNPEGPEGNPDPVAAGQDIREAFSRMGMTDEETVALIAGGHTFGKTHGAHPDDRLSPEPEAAPLEDQGLGWNSPYGTGKGDDTVVSGIEVTWTYHPTRWDNEFFHILFGYEWELVTGEGGHYHWRPKDGAGSDMVPMAHSAGRREPRMLTTDVALRFDPVFEPISRRFAQDQASLSDAFARAWFKLTHRDMGPKARYLGPEVPAEDLIWQDPLPAVDFALIDDADAAELKAQILASGLTVSQLVRTTWAAASTFRGGDKRGGVNGARIRLAPQKDWAVNNPTELASVLAVLEGIQASFNAAQTGDKRVSLADLIVLAGNAAVEKAATDAGFPTTVPFHPGRVDATQEQTDIESFGFLEPIADGFRNYASPEATLPAEHLLVDKAQQLTLTVPEMTVLVGGLRALNANWDGSAYGVFTDRPGVLTNDVFVKLLDLGTTWTPLDPGKHAFSGTTASGEPFGIGTRADLVFGSNAELRAVAEYYAADDAHEAFVADFVKAWAKVTELDRFDLR